MNQHWTVFGVLVGVGLIAITPVSNDGASAQQGRGELPTPVELLAQVPRNLSAQVPHDVDIPLQKKLTAAKKFAEVQLLFDILSWESFVAASLK